MSDICYQVSSVYPQFCVDGLQLKPNDKIWLSKEVHSGPSARKGSSLYHVLVVFVSCQPSYDEESFPGRIQEGFIG